MAGDASDEASRSARGSGWEARRRWKAASAAERSVLEDDMRVDSSPSNAAGSPPSSAAAAAWSSADAIGSGSNPGRAAAARV